MTCFVSPVSTSQTSTVMATAESAWTRSTSFAQGPVRIQNAASSQRYQVGRTVGPFVATRAVSGCARKASTSKSAAVRRCYVGRSHTETWLGLSLVNG